MGRKGIGESLRGLGEDEHRLLETCQSVYQARTDRKGKLGKRRWVNGGQNVGQSGVELECLIEDLEIRG